MKNTFAGLVILSILGFSSCGNAASPEKKSDSAISESVEQTSSPSNDQAENSPAVAETSTGKVINLTKAMFLKQVYNYEANPNKWTFIGDKPCIIDFYADWCKPCKMVAPIMDELAAKYKDQIVIYKINTEQERELAQYFGIRSIPTMLFCPVSADPQMTQGAMDKATYEKIINEVLLKK
jgi:thioredoxin